MSVDWEQIVVEGKKLAHLMEKAKVDLTEANKVLEYYKSTRYNDNKLREFLELMIEDPVSRTKRTTDYYRDLRKVLLEQWRTELEDEKKAMAWGWAMKIAGRG